MKYVARGLPAIEAEGEVVGFWSTLSTPSRDAPRSLTGHDRAAFRWGYVTNPVMPARCFLLDGIDGADGDSAGGSRRVLGMVGVGARRVVIGGEELSASILGGFYVDKNHRTFFPALT